MSSMQSHRRASPPRERFQDLRGAEVLVVSVLRLWAEPLREPERQHPHWQDGMIEAGLSNEAAVAFDTLMRIVLAATTRSLDLHRPPCPGLGTDEALLLDMLRLAQRGQHGEAGLLMNDWLPLAGVRMAMAPLCVLAAALARAGLTLPDPDEESRMPGRTAAGRIDRSRPTADRGATLLH
ncbi:hypothetical protein J2848_007029 [Azospirillum lipoferum]|uniref:Uncharacterized protein n=1 Tax=Azospirillum lipoferum TaxID=193 RepID=A0A5A9GIB7_AZOLI|nr:MULTISPECIES: hypothetical protein [Azospirillum]KAA0594181.1 hypothetical protein FZ942_22465 [Azospirillum lipoferum]MCP1615316.1 hypothetical protein [Azospirillum lipoferum]MDW5531536.1 hypothetical protein [Azospirillum sp. NL1]